MLHIAVSYQRDPCTLGKIYFNIEFVIAKFISQVTLDDCWVEAIGSNSIVHHFHSRGKLRNDRLLGLIGL